MSPENIRVIKEEVCPLIAAGEASLLLGAGFSFKNPSRSGTLPTGIGLRDQLLSACGTTAGPNTTLRDAYTFAKRKLPDLNQFLTDTFTVTTVHKWQARIFEYVWTRIYTTNIDNVLDVAYSNCRSTGRNSAEFTFLNYSDKGVVNQTLGSFPVITVHGTIRDIKAGFIFSNEEYGIASSRKILDWHNDLAAHMLAGGLIVIGNQLDESDFDTHLATRIQQYGEDTTASPNWIVMPNPDPIKMDNYIAAGYTVIDSTAEEFFEIVFAEVAPKTIGEMYAERVPTVERMVRKQGASVWFMEAFNTVQIELENAARETGILRNFMTGAHPSWFYIYNNAQAVTPKIDALTRVVSKSLRSNKNKFGILHVTGPSGSGKTTAIRTAVKTVMSQFKYIYEFDSSKGLNVDYLHSITQNFKEKAVLIFYSAAPFYYSINALGKVLKDSETPYILFILEERTRTYRKNKNHLADCASFSEEFEFGRASFDDAKSIATKLLNHGFSFPGFSELSIERQAQTILDAERGYHGDLLSTLFSLTSNQNFEDKLYQEYHSIDNDEARDIIDVVSMVNYVNGPLPLNYISGFLDIQQNRVIEHLNNELSGLINPLPPTQHIICRHRRIADFYFKSCIAHRGKFETIIGVLEFLSRQFTVADIRFHPLAYEIYKHLISFSFLYKEYFPRESRRADTERTFHEAQRFFGTDGIFWLQFGRLYREVDELDEAIDCFRTGLTYYDSFQTQHALGTTLLDRYIKNGFAVEQDFEEGINRLEGERIGRGTMDPYPTTTLCVQLLKITRLQPGNEAAHKQLRFYLNYGLEHFKEDGQFMRIFKEALRKGT